MLEKNVDSIEGLLAALREDTAEYRGALWYRGQGNSGWSLTPGYLRAANPPSEATLLKRFKQSAAMLIEIAPQATFDWLFLMQHYGVPTRLLDWSESPLVALYFAVENFKNDEDSDGALWILKPSELNKNAHINNQDEEGYIPSFDDDELAGYTVESLARNQRVQLLPVATIATRNNARIQAQLGVFTIHHLDRTSIETVGDSSHVIKYTIPGGSKRHIFEQLALLGFTRFQLFPELSSVGEIVKGVVQ